MPRIRTGRAGALAAAAAAVIAISGCGSTASFPPDPAWLTAQQLPAGRFPAYFIDNEAWTPVTGYSWSDFIVRDAATGRPVAQHGHGISHTITAVAAVGRGDAFIAAEEAPLDCGSQLYWFRLDQQGHVGPLSPVGPALHGEVNLLAASQDGRTIAYTLGGCASGTKGYLKVADLRTGQIRRWSSVNLTGSGSLGLASGLSLSANGRLLTFVGWIPHRNRASVRVLRTDGPPGNLLGRSRAVLQLPATPRGRKPRDAVAISPNGSGFALCTSGAGQRGQVTTVTLHQTRTGKLVRTLLTLDASQPGRYPLTGCAMSVSRDGTHALVPSGVSYPDPGSGTAQLTAVRLDLATGEPVMLSFPVRLNPAMPGPRSAAVSVTW